MKIALSVAAFVLVFGWILEQADPFAPSEHECRWARAWTQRQANAIAACRETANCKTTVEDFKRLEGRQAREAYYCRGESNE